ncbi:hypothetical protein E2C01_073290 [Portunus trituberculatus]|uniref:Uncharacterized protein n=1 Tax=Portunus trituberculatus TaxID=210409 RepID=A0A5B7I920_PORTR|nr:hypothetical protein [Portunus trituberculatus]
MPSSAYSAQTPIIPPKSLQSRPNTAAGQPYTAKLRGTSLLLHVPSPAGRLLVNRRAYTPTHHPLHRK